MNKNITAGEVEQSLRQFIEKHGVDLTAKIIYLAISSTSADAKECAYKCRAIGQDLQQYGDDEDIFNAGHHKRSI